MWEQLIVNDGRGDAQQRHGGQKGGEHPQRDAARKTEILVAEVNPHPGLDDTPQVGRRLLILRLGYIVHSYSVILDMSLCHLPASPSRSPKTSSRPPIAAPKNWIARVAG